MDIISVVADLGLVVFFVILLAIVTVWVGEKL
jgi:hypothetical protein